MTTDFEVVACHCDHAGQAHLTLRHLVGGSEVAIQQMPFETEEPESLAQEQARILADAARVARAAAEFLECEARQARAWPTRSTEGEPIQRG
jgi:hypothetical protein